MARKIQHCSIARTSLQVNMDNGLAEWLVANAPKTAVTLLAFDLDGLVWGRIQEGQLYIAHDYSVGLKPDTVQEVRLFGEKAELHLWRTSNGLQAQTIVEADGEDQEYIDEAHILWGDQAQPIGSSGFSLMSDGVEGLHHAVPIALNLNDEDSSRPLRLKVRHYLAPNEPFARIAHSRLVNLEVTHDQA